MIAEPKRCGIAVDVHGDTYDSATWADLWYAATAVSTMCVKNGMAGWSNGLGEIAH